MNGYVGSRVRVPLYTPRLPGLGGGGGGVFQPRGGTPWKPNRLAEGIGGLGQMYGSYLQGTELGRKRRMEEELFPLEKELLSARARYYSQPRGTVYPESYQKDLAAAVDAINTGEYDVFQVFRSMSQRYPGQSAELRRILLAEEPASNLEAWFETKLREDPEYREQWDKEKTLKKQFQLPGATPFGITPLPGARSGIPTPLPGARPGAIPTPLPETKYITPKQRVPTDIELQGMPSKVTPGLEALAKRKLEPKRGEMDVIGELARKPKEEPRKAKPTRQTFEDYPAPKTEKEFDNTIKHIPSKEMKILYFETMIRRIEDEKLAKKLYQKWGDELYE